MFEGSTVESNDGTLDGIKGGISDGKRDGSFDGYNIGEIIGCGDGLCEDWNDG